MLIDDAPAFFQLIPHFLYHISIATIHSLIPILSLSAASAIVMTVSSVATTVILYVTLCLTLIRTYSFSRIFTPVFVALAGALVLMILAPVTFLTPTNMYYGYFTPNVYHNPTVHTMKPFAVALFLLCLTVFDDKSRIAHSRPWLLGAVMLTLLCLLAKPSFHMALLPALGLVALVRLMTRQRINWLMLLAIGLPAGLLLLSQMFLWQSVRDSEIAIAPLRLFNTWAEYYHPNANQWLLLKLILSLVFPLLTTMFIWRHAQRSVAYQLSWVCLLIGLAYSYLLIETFEINAGNFIWTAQIGVFLVFLTSLVMMCRHWSSISLAGKCFLSLVLLVHGFEGVLWYMVNYTP